ncbi:hypothetical protein C0Q70_08711 [Pomacea canaliculata]|uniref:Malate dehydrogenase n=1 Tax=Pomacea canaliculata TaxID=400727 RepID=A0A2T7P7R4_POMCA|nr:hypothetical protein C0Q70_08711 [Pomacea canaliculata]
MACVVSSSPPINALYSSHSPGCLHHVTVPHTATSQDTPMASEQVGGAAAGDQEDGVVMVTCQELQAFCVRCLQKVGAVTDHAQAMAELIVAADYRGHYSHGLNRIGAVVATFAMDLAIRKAKDVGIGWVSVRGSGHFGIAGWYSLRAMEQGLIGMAFTNASANMVPTRATQSTLGANPIAVAAPAKDGDSFVLDMSTTTVAAGKVEVKRTMQQPLPAGWAVDCDGKPTTDPNKMINGGGLMPLGGAEETGGYKGYGLSMMVEVFCGILSGATFGPFVPRWSKHNAPVNLGQCFVALDPQVFAPGFADRLSQLLNHCRNLQPAEGESEVLVPGDPERQHMEKCDALEGIPYTRKQIDWARNCLGGRF